MAMRDAPSSTPSSSSRLPAVSASDVLRELQGDERHESAILSTGAQALDNLLRGGLEIGKTTELWGPVGAGKTAITLTAAVEATGLQRTVIWAACASPLSTQRLKAILPTESLKHFHSINLPTLTHLLAFIQHSIDDDQIYSATSLLVIDDLNTLIDFDYPRQAAYASSSDSEARKWQAGRRAVVLAAIVSALNRLANTYRLAVVVINGSATSMRADPGLGPVMVSAVGGSEWDAGIWNRLAAFQDFNGRFIALQKIHGSNTANRASNSPILKFKLSKLGLLIEEGSTTVPTSSISVAQAMLSSDQAPKKRTYEEIADSEDEYGWEDFEESDVLSSQPHPADG